jgi:transposase
VQPSQGKKANRADKPKREGPRKGSLGRNGGGRALVANPDETVIARPICCSHCQAALHEDDRQSNPCSVNSREAFPSVQSLKRPW